MIPFLFFLLFLIVWAGLAFALTARGMNAPWSRSGPGVVGRHLQSRNRLVLGVTLAIVVLLGVMEAILPAVSDSVQDLQYRVGDATGADLLFVAQTGNGSLSWGLYLAVLLGTLAGLLLGTMAAIRRYPILRGLTLRSLI